MAFFNNEIFKSSQFKSKQKIEIAIKGLGVRYSNDRVVASLSFGFWVNLFAPKQFRLAGQNLHKIFPNRPKGTKPNDIFIDLTSILEIRNRVAHHEHICFNRIQLIDLSNTISIYHTIIKLTQWMAIDNIKFYNNLDNTLEIISEIETFNNY